MPDKASVYCLPCHGGTHQPSDGETNCLHCPAGFFSNINANSNETCEKCSLGYYAPNSGLSACVECPKGRFGGSSAGECQDCEAGKFRDDTSHRLTLCMPCAEGKTSSLASSNCRDVSVSNGVVLPFNVTLSVSDPESSVGRHTLSLAWSYPSVDDYAKMPLYFNVSYTVKQGYECNDYGNRNIDAGGQNTLANRTNEKVEAASSRRFVRRSGCCDPADRIGGRSVTRSVKILNPDRNRSSMAVSQYEANVSLFEPVWCTNPEYIGIEAVTRSDKSNRDNRDLQLLLRWVSTDRCGGSSQYLNRSELGRPSSWGCAVCPRGADCDGSTTWEDVRPLFGWFRLTNGNMEEEEEEEEEEEAEEENTKDTPLKEAIFENFVECKFAPACKGAPNLDLAGIFNVPCSSDAADCERDPALQTGQREDCNWEAGYERYCGPTPNKTLCRLCATCRSGFQRSSQGFGYKCEECPPRDENLVWLIFGGVLALIIVLVLVKVGMSDVLEENPSEAMNRILVNVMQVISIFASFPLKWPAALLQLFKMNQAVAVLGESLVNPSCELSWSAKNIFYSKTIGLAVAPIVIVFCSSLVWRVWALVMRQSFRYGLSLERTKQAARQALDGTQDLEKSVELAAVAQKVHGEDFVDLHADAHDSRIGRASLQSEKDVRNKIVSELKARKPTPKDKFYVSTVILLYLFYPSACKNTFQILACTQVGLDRWYLSADLQQECYRGTHLTIVLAFCLPQLLLYVTGLPVAAFLVLFKNRDQLETARTKFRWGILYVGLRRERYYWEVIVAIRKAAMFSLSVMAQSETGLAVQTHMAMFVLMLCVVAHLMGRPYMAAMYLLDLFEVSGLVVCWMLMWSGIVFYLPSSTDLQVEMITVALMMLSVVYMLGMAIVIVRQKAREGAPWTKVVARSICGCMSEKTSQRLFGWIPVVERSAQYSQKYRTSNENRAEEQEGNLKWTENPNRTVKGDVEKTIC